MGRRVVFGGREPRVAPDAFVADTATLVGDVELGPQSSVWYGAVLRGDVGPIRVGARTNIQDHCLLHVSGGRCGTEIGEEVTIGHRVLVHSARVGDGALVGSGAILLDEVEVGEEAVVAAGTLLVPGTRIPPRTLVRGHPGQVVRKLGPEEWCQGRRGAQRYLELVLAYRKQG